jgi:hypothetical protein
MNERIKDIIEKSGLYIAYDNKEVTDKELEFFAELIVRECSKVIVNGGYWTGGISGERRQCTPPEIAQMIKQHFGVEESTASQRMADAGYTRRPRGWTKEDEE